MVYSTWRSAETADVGSWTFVNRCPVLHIDAWAVERGSGVDIVVLPSVIGFGFPRGFVYIVLIEEDRK